jgi:arylsulfatase A-like enzyme
MKKQKTIIIVSILIAVVLAVIYFISPGSPGDSSDIPGTYNLIIIVPDALRADVLGCYGGDARTPNIDWLARNGTLFENAYSTAPCTMPSAVSMFTGNYSRTYGVIIKKGHEKLERRAHSFYVNNNETLPGEALKEAGYDVRMDIENVLASRSNNLQGFSKFRKMEKMSRQEIQFVEDKTGIRNIGYNKNPRVSSGYDRLYDLLNYLLTVPRHRPFFIVKWFADPHAPYNPPAKSRKRINIDTAKLPRDIDFYTRLRKRKGVRLSVYEEGFLKGLYKAEVESVDERVGFIIKALKQRGLLRDTIIVLTSDHGESLGEHGKWGHGYYFYEQLVNIPLIFKGPGIPPKKRVKTFVSHLDLAPTLTDLVGAKYPANMQGNSYTCLFKGGKTRDRILYFDRVTNYLEAPRANSDALLMDGHKLIVERNKENVTFYLYNLAGDPGEMKNIFNRNKDIFKNLFNQLIKIRDENKKRLNQNLANAGNDVNLSREYKKTLNALKALGYIE